VGDGGDPFPTGNQSGHFDAGYLYGTDHEVLFPPEMKRSLTNEVRFKLRGPSYGALYPGSCNSVFYDPTCMGTNATGLKQISFTLAKIRFFGEVYGEEQIPREVKVGLILRSPNEHGSVLRAGSKNLGDRLIILNDRFIRDFFSTSVVIRNIYYQSL
jgi:hypothetical protein